MEHSVKEKLLASIKSFNETQADRHDAAKDEKRVVFIRKVIESCKNAEDAVVKDLVLTLFKFNYKFFKVSGDDILECLWTLYNPKAIYLEEASAIKDEKKSPLSIFKTSLKQFLQFSSANIDSLVTSGIISFSEINENQKTSVVLEFCEQQLLLNFIEKFDISRNFILDLIVLLIYTQSEFQQFYTSLSTFLVTTNCSTVLLFKIISLFSMCFVNLEKKENFVDSYLFVLGSVLRDHARSYLKTKNKFNESLTYHVCKKKHKKSDHNYTDPIILSSIECDFLEQNFLYVILNLFISITYNLNFDEKWEDYLEIFYKYLDAEDMDVEETINPEIAITHHVMLFVSDFLFFFVSNFMEYSLGEDGKVY